VLRGDGHPQHEAAAQVQRQARSDQSYVAVFAFSSDASCADEVVATTALSIVLGITYLPRCSARPARITAAASRGESTRQLGAQPLCGVKNAGNSSVLRGNECKSRAVRVAVRAMQDAPHVHRCCPSHAHTRVRAPT
jgi:hypothetical protein